MGEYSHLIPPEGANPGEEFIVGLEQSDGSGRGGCYCRQADSLAYGVASLDADILAWAHEKWFPHP